MSHRIFIVEDDRVIAAAVKRHIESWGCEARVVQDLRNVVKEFVAFDPHLVLTKDREDPVHYRMEFTGQTPKVNHFALTVTPPSASATAPAACMAAASPYPQVTPMVGMPWSLAPSTS